jgi:hypothetical protein
MAIQSRPLDRLWQALVLAVACAFLLAAARANFDLVAGRHALFMDERITFDGVSRILHAPDAERFVWAVTDGSDQRYGRALWNTMAAAAFLPERIWGAAGQIVAGRMLQAMLLVAAAVVLALALVRHWSLRSLLVLALLCLPYSDYFATNPKPEPLQMLCLAGFAALALRARSAFGPHWLLLGIAFGAKVSALPVLAVFGAAALWVEWRKGHATRTLENAASAAIWLFGGFALAVPVFIEPLIWTLAGVAILALLRMRLRWGPTAQAALLLGCLFYPLFERAATVAAWAADPLMNTVHGSDRPDVTPWRWLSYFTGDWLAMPAPVAAALIALALGFCGWHLVRPRGRPDPDTLDRRALAFTLCAAGAAWLLVIFATAQRLWGFYLFPGMALFLSGIAMLIDLSLDGRAGRGERAAASCVAAAIGVAALACWAPLTIANLDRQAKRTQTAEYASAAEAYAMVQRVLAELPPPAAGRLLIAFDPLLFAPASNARMRIIEFAGPFTGWNERLDAIVFSRKHTPAGEPVPEGSPLRRAYLSEQQGYAQHVAEGAGRCLASHCYRRAATLPEGGEILVLDR